MPHSPTPPAFRRSSALVGGMAAIGGSAFLGTVITNVTLWLSQASGLTLQEAYAQIPFNLTSSTELLSFAALFVSGVFGGYVSALHGSGRHLAQGLIAGAITCLFFIAMSFGPSDTRPPGWFILFHLVLALCLAFSVATSMHGAPNPSLHRFLLLGLSSSLRLLVVAHCFREAAGVIRIISARKATREEERFYP